MQTKLLSSLIPLLLAAPTAAFADRDHDQVSCTQEVLPVSLVPGTRATSWVYGQLCAPGERLRDGAPIQILLHGASYNHGYWDFGRVDGVDYSYARAMADAGIATFSYDQLGAGFSTHPSSTSPEFADGFGDATYVLHQVIDSLRAGALGGARFGKVITVGNSLGSLVAWAEADHYQDVDGIIATGMIHYLGPAVVAAITNDFYTANLDPAFAKAGLDDGYLTTRPGTRSVIFVSTVGGDADPKLIALDDQRKDVVSGSVLSGAVPQIITKHGNVNVPVLTVIGSEDVLCDSLVPCTSSKFLVQHEAPWYGPRARLEACAVPGAAHSVALHIKGHATAEEASIRWTRALLDGARTSGPLAPGCAP